MNGLHQPLAIVALNCRLPGAANAEEFWDNLKSGRDSISEMPPERLNRDLYFDEKTDQLAKTYSVLAGLMPEQTFPQQDLAKWDPAHLAFLSLAKKSWSGVQSVEAEKVGVYVGHSGGSGLAGEIVFGENIIQALADFEPRIAELGEILAQGRPTRSDSGPKVEARMAAKLVAQELELTGPAMVVDAACASSLAALAIAALALDSGEIEAAIVGGASYAKADSLVLFSQAHSCTNRGSFPFDTRADGLVGSEGAVCIVVKTLQRALDDGDTVKAVIRGLGLATDGRGRSLWAPRREGQLLALKRAYEGLDPAELSYIEAHATSTQVGDATEVEALTDFLEAHLGARKIPMGSVKSNLGHTLETAGFASLSKVLLAMEHGHLPASIKVEELNRNVDWGSVPVEVLRESREWDAQGLVGISAFGIGGLNVHLVVESYSSYSQRALPPLSPDLAAEDIVIVGRGIVADGISSVADLTRRPMSGRAVKDYRFDGLALRIPPRLIENGDPLGFMLLDAAGQALSGPMGQAKTTAVVVATSFGNRFTDELQMGLHLPEIESHLSQRLEPEEVAAFREEFLKAFPAIQDETGGFTSSSAASRISKAFDLNGGALALDAGGCSSSDALSMASALLRRGGCQAVLCCAGERNSVHVGHGAGALLLKRRSVAEADGDPVLGVVPSSARAWLNAPGPYGAAQGVLDLLASTVEKSWLRFQSSGQNLEEVQDKLASSQQTRFSKSDRYRVSVVASDRESLRKKLDLAAAQISQRRLLEEQGVFLTRVRSERPRIAFCFAGQGSQYQGMLKSLVCGSVDYQKAEEVLASLGLPTFAAMAWSGNAALDSDPVITQVSLLVADWLMYRQLLDRGMRPDCVVGHSFGEFAALVAAEVLSLEQAIRLTKLRATALADTPEGGLISVLASADDLDAYLSGSGLSITHKNSPQQTVIGGAKSAIEDFLPILKELGFNFRELRVPGALHTTLVAPAQKALKEALDKELFRPPTTLFLSNVSNRYGTNSDELKTNLVNQLVDPVNYVDLVNKMVADGIEVMVEVGPGRTLTALHRQILPDAEVVLCSTDHPRRDTHEQLARLELLFEALEPQPIEAGSSVVPTLRSKVFPIENFDATTARKSKPRKNKATDSKVEMVSESLPSQGQARQDIQTFLLDFVADLTGYPLEVIDLDWDLEADLGVDSIKRTQLFGELVDLVGDGDPQDLVDADFRTLRAIIDWLAQVAPANTAVAEPEQELPVRDLAFEEGVTLGQKHRELLRKWLRDRVQSESRQPKSSQLSSKLRGVAQGAGVHPLSLTVFAQERFPWEKPVTSRYVLRMVKAPLPAGAPKKPILTGAALVIGRGEVADSLCAAIDIPFYRVSSLEELKALSTPLAHLFLVTATEPQAKTSLTSWPGRREAFMETYWMCQEWFRKLKEHKLESIASVTAATIMGGDFGLSGQICAAEGGAVSGLLKALCIEFWVAGHRGVSLRVIDSPENRKAQDVVDSMLGELAVSRHEVETGWVNGERHLVKTFPEPVPDGDQKPSGVWVCTGGGRGITAHVVAELKSRYDLTVHILGRAPIPEVREEWRSYWPQARSELKVYVMDQARKVGQEPVKAWRKAEKALEIEGTLKAVPGAVYHSVDVSDRAALAEVLESIRQQDGPIRGVLHGAGVSRDSRFDQKSPEWVEKCVKAKVDGTVALMELTMQDPLEHFVAFGSISGRFGANGQTDYSMTNDMMAKLVDWYRSQRPEVAAVTFHWHAWGDVGMATRPETEFGLQQIAMQFMPAKEGLDHLCRELEAGAPESEVLITDDRYHRLFTPGDSEATNTQPLLSEAVKDDKSWSVTFDPERENFLKDHKLFGNPVLPLVIGLELFAEVNKVQLPLTFTEVQASEALVYSNGTAQALRVEVEENGWSRIQTHRLARDGRILQRDRLVFQGRVGSGYTPKQISVPKLSESWTQVDYSEGLGFYHGPSFQGLQAWQSHGEEMWGRIAAPGTAHLLHPSRSAAGWIIPSASLDACLYAVGLLVALKTGGGSAPKSLKSLSVLKRPNAGEHCLVRVRADEAFDDMEFQLLSESGELLLSASGYAVSLLKQSSKVASR